MKSIKIKGFKLLPPDFDFTYQKDLTQNLDQFQGSFGQSTVNEIMPFTKEDRINTVYGGGLGAAASNNKLRRYDAQEG